MRVEGELMQFDVTGRFARPRPVGSAPSRICRTLIPAPGVTEDRRTLMHMQDDAAPPMRPNHRRQACAPMRDEHCIRRALKVLERRLRHDMEHLRGSDDAKNFARLRLERYDYEVVALLWLDSQNRLLEYQELFRGTVRKSMVYPREILREAMRFNATGCILCHNHPGGDYDSSKVDDAMTRVVKSTLRLIDVELVDHIVVSAGGAISMAEYGVL